MLLLEKEIGLEPRALGLGDEAALQELLGASEDYFHLVHGESAQPGEARVTLTERPPVVPAEGKRVIGFFAKDALRGVLDYLRGYRTPLEWYLGFLLLHPAWRSGGRGAGIVEAFARQASLAGAQRIRLAVAEQNTAGLKFWQRCGFHEERRMPPRRIGVRETVLVEMVREVAGPPSSRLSTS